MYRKPPFFFLILLIFITIASVSAQFTELEITIYGDKDSLIVYIPDQSIEGNINLKGFGYTYYDTANATKTLYLERVPGFSFSFDDVPFPACIRLLRQNTPSVPPLACQTLPLPTAMLADADVFWFSTQSNNYRQFVLTINGITDNDKIFSWAGPSQNFRISILTAPEPTAAIDTPPTATNTPAPTATPPPITPQPPSGTVSVTFLFAPESVYFTDPGGVIEQFNAWACQQGINPIDKVTPLPSKYCIVAQPASSGQVTDSLVKLLGPSSAYLANPNIDTHQVLLEGKPPILWQPSTTRWLGLVNLRTGQPIYTLSDPYALSDRLTSRATTREPSIIAIWRTHYEALRARRGTSLGWNDLHEVRSSRNGWCDYGVNKCHPAVLYGQTDPRISSTALDTLMAQFYAIAGIQPGQQLTLTAVADSAIRDGVRNFQSMARHYADITPVFREYLFLGPDYIDFVALDENSLIALNRGQLNRFPPQDLIALYPEEGIFWQERPMGISNLAGQEEKEAARTFVDFVLSEPIQRLIMSYGFRPADTDIQLDETLWGEGCTIPRCGISIDANAISDRTPPSAEVVDAIQQSWIGNQQYDSVKRQADVTILFDTSGSMTSDKLEPAKQAAILLLNLLDEDMNARLVTFNRRVNPISELASVPLVRPQLISQISSFVPSDPGADYDTALYDAILRSLEAIRAEASSNIQVIIVLSDGKDTQGVYSVEQAIASISASWKTQNPVFVIPIAYGEAADVAKLEQIGRASFIFDHVTNKPYFSANTGDINALLERIRRYF